MAFALPANSTIDHVAELAERLPAVLADGGHERLSIDAGELVDCDSATLALLLQARRLAQAVGAAFVVDRPPRQLVQLAALYGVDAMLGLDADDADDAAAG